MTAFCLCKVDGKSFNRKDVVRLKGDDSCSLSKPLKEPCLINISLVALGRCTANGLSTDFTGTGSKNRKINQ